MVAHRPSIDCLSPRGPLLHHAMYLGVEAVAGTRAPVSNPAGVDSRLEAAGTRLHGPYRPCQQKLSTVVVELFNFLMTHIRPGSLFPGRGQVMDLSGHSAPTQSLTATALMGRQSWRNPS